MTDKPLSKKFIARVVSRMARNLRRVMTVCFIVAVIASVWALTRPPRWGPGRRP